MKRKSYAKLNIALSVLNKGKPANLHDLDMVNVTVSLYDTISIEFVKDSLNKTTIVCKNEDVPKDDNNLVCKVINKFKRTFNLSFSCVVKINKKIPVQSGLAGGSSNAACVLHMLDKKFKTKMSLLQKINFIKPLTSDGPFLLVNKPCRVKGCGDVIEPITYNLKSKILIVKPLSGCNTKDIFSSLNYKRLKRPNINKVCAALKDNDLPLLSSHVNNSLIDSAMEENQEIMDVINRLKTCGFEIVSMSGSGSTCFAISNSSFSFKKAKEILNKHNYDIIKVCKVKN